MHGQVEGLAENYTAEASNLIGLFIHSAVRRTGLSLCVCVCVSATHIARSVLDGLAAQIPKPSALKS